MTAPRAAAPGTAAAGAGSQDPPLPRVTVQLPFYNEMYVVDRLVEAVVRMGGDVNVDARHVGAELQVLVERALHLDASHLGATLHLKMLSESGEVQY